MSTLQYRGAPVAANPDLVYQDYLNSVKSADMSTAAIDAAINSGLTGYATTAYVDAQDALNATKAYIDAGDATRIHLSQQNIANGVAPLDANGKMSTARINAVLTQRWVRGPWTPSAYHSAQVDVTTGEQTLFSCPVSDPGWPYKLVVFGLLDGRSSIDAEYPVVNIRVADATAGEIVARGTGMSDAADTAVPTLGENFLGTFPDGLDSGTWNQTALIGSAGHYQVINNQAQWVQSGTADQLWRFRRLGTDATTLTNYQKLRLTIGAAIGEAPVFGSPQYVQLCARMNTAETDWVGFQITDTTFTMQHCENGIIATIGGAGWTVSPSASFSTSPASGTTYDILAGTTGSLRQFLYYRNNVLIGGAVDGSGVTKADAGHRGWGWYAFAAGRPILFDQCDPPDIADLLVSDAPPSFGSISVMPNSPATMAARTGPTTLFVRGTRSGSASTASFSPYQPKLNVYTVPA